MPNHQPEREATTEGHNSERANTHPEPVKAQVQPTVPKPDKNVVVPQYVFLANERNMDEI